MRMDDQEESQNVEDVRGSSGGFRPIHGIGLGTIVLALIGGWIFGINPLQILGLLSGDGSSAVQTAPESAGAGSTGRRCAGEVRIASAAQHRDGLGQRVRRARPTV